jgi:hypothetical protein
MSEQVRWNAAQNSDESKVKVMFEEKGVINI